MFFANIQLNDKTFYTPQLPLQINHNRQTWENRESYTCTLVNQGNEVYVIMGNYDSGGTGSYRMFVDAIETATGYDLLSAVVDNIE